MTRTNLIEQLQRQSLWLKEHWLWLLRNRVIGDGGTRPKALDVGCGPGFVMEVLNEVMDVEGIDKDQDMVSLCRTKGLKVEHGLAEELPFGEGDFDVVYCSYVLLWVKDPVKVLREMRRVSRKWVLCLAEPDFASRIDHPMELVRFRELIMEGLKEKGGDPMMGRKLMGLFSECGLDAEVGIHPGSYDKARQKKEIDAEWRFVMDLIGDRLGTDDLETLKARHRDALDKGALFQFSPTFYAIASI